MRGLTSGLILGLSACFATTALAADCADSSLPVAQEIREITAAGAIQSQQDFNAYIDSLLAAQEGDAAARLRRKGISSPAAIRDVYSIGMHASCFSQAEWNDLWDWQKKEVLAQAEAAVYFVADVHVALRGNDVPPFREVRLCHESVTIMNETTLDRNADVLNLVMGQANLGLGFEPLDAKALMNEWNNNGGLEFARTGLTDYLFYFSEPASQKKWQLIGNDMGVIRVRIRDILPKVLSAVRTRASSFIAEIDGVTTQSLPRPALAEHTQGLVGKHVDPMYRRDGQTQSLASEATDVINRLNSEGLNALLTQWGAFSANEGNQDKARNSIGHVAANKITKIKRHTKDVTFVIQNHHKIHIAAFFSSTDMDQYVTAPTDNILEIDETVEDAFVAVNTSDDIEIYAVLAMIGGMTERSRALNTAGLAHALEGVRNVPEYQK